MEEYHFGMTRTSLAMPHRNPRRAEIESVLASPAIIDVDAMPDYGHLGNECAIQTLYEGHSKCGCCVNWVEECPAEIEADAKEKEAYEQKAILARMRKSHDDMASSPLTLESIVIQNPSLKKTLTEVFAGYTGITPTYKNLVFREPFYPLHYRWDRLRAILHRQREEDPEAASYTELLWNLMDKEFEPTRVEVNDLVSRGVITFGLLWAIMEPGIHVCSGERIYLLNHALYVNGEFGFNARVQFVDWDGKEFGYADLGMSIPPFNGTRPIHSLGVFPLKFHPSRRDFVSNAVRRGRIFQDLRGFHYKGFDGMASVMVRGGFVDQTVQARIIIDAASYFASNPGQRIEELRPRHKQNPGKDKQGYFNDPFRENRRGDTRASTVIQTTDSTSNTDLTEDQLMMCTPWVRGYSLKLKRWGKFHVDFVKEISWNDAAFPSVMLPLGYKDLIMSFVEGQTRSKEGKLIPFDDVIEGKGLGVIMLLVGNPGTGKTLTAEAVADRVRRPLYYLSAGELGNDSDDIEASLTHVLDMAEKWNAVLLFDECDVFLQQRSSSDFLRNEIVAVFLRILEYYRGMLIMTTNRAEAIDRAFQSRIHLTLHYPDLGSEAKEHIWRQFVGDTKDKAAGGSSKISDESYAHLAQLPLNGRQFKNVVKISTLLAAQRGSELGLDHLRTVLTATGDVDGVGGL